NRPPYKAVLSWIVPLQIPRNGCVCGVVLFRSQLREPTPSLVGGQSLGGNCSGREVSVNLGLSNHELAKFLESAFRSTGQRWGGRLFGLVRLGLRDFWRSGWLWFFLRHVLVRQQRLRRVARWE